MRTTVLAAVLGVLAAPALAQSTSHAEQLVQEKQCLSCHAADKEGTGPSFKSIAERYRGVKNAQAQLVQVVLKGTDGKAGYHWGTQHMPSAGARVNLTRAEAEEVVGYVLTRGQ